MPLLARCRTLMPSSLVISTCPPIQRLQASRESPGEISRAYHRRMLLPSSQYDPKTTGCTNNGTAASLSPTHLHPAIPPGHVPYPTRGIYPCATCCSTSFVRAACHGPGNVAHPPSTHNQSCAEFAYTAYLYKTPSRCRASSLFRLPYSATPQCPNHWSLPRSSAIPLT